MTNTKYILCLDGGGVRGKFTGAFLKALEKALIKSEKKDITCIQSVFDMYVGTSTGAILAAALASGKYNAKQVCDEVYSNDNAKHIFSRKGGWFWKRWTMRCPKYAAEPRYEIGLRFFGNIRMHDLPYKYIATTYNCRARKPYFWTNIGKGPNPRVLHVIGASSAAPTYFPAALVPFPEEFVGNEYEVPQRKGEILKIFAKPDPKDAYVDGGVSANAPSTIAAAYADLLWGEAGDDSDDTTEPCEIKVLSVGTGAERKPFKFEDVQNAGGLQWLAKYDLIGIMMDSSDQVNQMESKILEGENFLRVNLEEFDDEVDLGMDNVDDTNMDRLVEYGKELFERNREKIMEFLDA